MHPLYYYLGVQYGCCTLYIKHIGRYKSKKLLLEYKIHKLLYLVSIEHLVFCAWMTFVEKFRPRPAPAPILNLFWNPAPPPPRFSRNFGSPLRPRPAFPKFLAPRSAPAPLHQKFWFPAPLPARRGGQRGAGAGSRAGRGRSLNIFPLNAS